MARIAIMLSISPEMVNVIDRIAHFDRRSRQDIIRNALELALPGMTQGVPKLDSEDASNDAEGAVGARTDGRTARFVCSPVKVARARVALAKAEERARFPSVVESTNKLVALELEAARAVLRAALGEPTPRPAPVFVAPVWPVVAPKPAWDPKTQPTVPVPWPVITPLAPAGWSTEMIPYEEDGETAPGETAGEPPKKEKATREKDDASK